MSKLTYLHFTFHYLIGNDDASAMHKLTDLTCIQYEHVTI